MTGRLAWTMVCLTLLSGCAEPPPDAFLSSFEPVAGQYVAALDIPGLAVVVTRGDDVVYQRAFGVQSVVDSASVTDRSLFHVASVTKTFTAAAVILLASRGELSLDDPLGRYVPCFAREGPPQSDITIRQVLSHTSGLSDVTDYGWDDPEVDEGALDRFVCAQAVTPLLAEPGTEFHYSNVGYSVLGDIVARLSGRSFEAELRELLLSPLGMNASSAYLPDVAARPELTEPHVVDAAYEVAPSPVRPYNRPHAPSSTLYTSTFDIARWLIRLTAGDAAGPSLIPSNLRDMMWTAQPGTDGGFGLGWALGDRHGLRTVSHSGGDLGYGAYVLLVPDSAVGVAVLSNYDRTPVQALAEALLDVELGYEPEPLHSVAGLQLDRSLYRAFRSGGADSATALFHALRDTEEFDFNQVRQLLGLAGNLREAGHPTQAAVTYGLAVDLYPDFAWLQLLHAQALLDAADSVAARDAVRRALALDPDSERGRHLAAVLNVDGED